MNRRHLLSLCAAAPVALCASGVLAGEEKKKEGGKDAKKEEIARTFETSPMALPVFWKGVVVNYVYTRLRLHFGHDTSISAVKAKEPYIKDLTVRAANRTPFTLGDNLNALDADALAKAVLPGISAIVGSGAVARVEVFEQVPQHRLPRP